MDIEKLATSEIVNLFAGTDRLVPHVMTGDKGISWDGYIQVYRNSGDNHSIDEYVDDVFLQVKGVRKAPDGEHVYYPVRVADIHNYGTKSPTIFFVVRIGTQEINRKVYYHVFREGDYEKLTLRSDWQQRKSCRFDVFPSIPEEIESLIYELIEEKQGRRQPLLGSFLREPEEKSLFLYDAEAVGFFGREKEMEQLQEFLDAPEGFLWWGIAAPGGAGKSRLAYEFRKSLDPVISGWQAHALKLADYKHLNKITEQYHGSLLLVADYAQSQLESLSRFIAEQYGRDRHLSRLRLLLLERDGGEEGGIYPWEEWLLRSTYGTYVRETRYKSTLHLEPLSDEAIICLIRSYAEALMKRESGLTALPEGKEAELLQKLKAVNGDDTRAFYAMLLTDVAMHEPNKEDWSLKGLLDIPLNREEKKLRYSVASLKIDGSDQPDSALLGSCQHIQRVATALGVSGDLAYGDIEDICPDALKALEEHGRGNNIRKILRQVGLITIHDEEGYIAAIRPDILGEYAILSFLKNCGWEQEDERNSFFYAVLRRTNLLIPFFKHLFRNHGYLTSDSSVWKKLFPKLNKLDNQQTASYIRLLIEAESWAHNSDQRNHFMSIVDGMEQRINCERGLHNGG